MRKKLLSSLLCIAMASSMLVGCGNKEDKAASTSGDDGVVKLKWYMSINPVAPDTQKVIDKLNEYTREKIGVEVDYQVIANPDYKEKMPTYINSGENFDICFTANWTTNYTQFAAKDAFMDITEMLPEYAKETYEFIPEKLWDAVKVNGKIYGVPSYKELGSQGGLFINTDMAKEYGINLDNIKNLADYTDVLKVVKEKSEAAGKSVIGISGLSNNMGFPLTNPFESLTGSASLPGVSAVSEFNNFKDEPEVFNQYETKEYMDYCKLVHEWYKSGYTSKDPVQYDSDIANRDNDFKNGNLFSYVIQFAPGADVATATTTGHGVTFVPLMKPLFETRSGMGGLLAVSSGSEHPEKALEFINLLNTDKYVGTLIRHGIEGEHYTAVGDNQVDRTMGGTLAIQDNGYDYTFGWQFGTPFNQKWDISYPENIEDLFNAYNAESITAPHNGFTFNTTGSDTVISAVTNVVAEYTQALETGMVNPEEKIPEFLEALEKNGVNDLLKSLQEQVDEFNKTK